MGVLLSLVLSSSLTPFVSVASGQNHAAIPFCASDVVATPITFLSPQPAPAPAAQAYVLFKRLWEQLDPENLEPETIKLFQSWYAKKIDRQTELVTLRKEFLEIVGRQKYGELSLVNQARAHFIVGSVARFPPQEWANGRLVTIVSEEEVRALYQLGQFQGASWSELDTILEEQGYTGVKSPVNRVGMIYVKKLEGGRSLGARIDPPARGTPFAHAHKESVPTVAVIDGRYESSVPGLRKFDDSGNYVPGRWADATHIQMLPRRRRSANSGQ